MDTNTKAGALVLALMLGAGTAHAQFQCTRISAEDPGPGPGCVNTFDCSTGCTEYTYGLSAPDSYEKIQDLSTSFSFQLAQFGGSVTYSRGTGNILDDNCGFERDYAPLFGKIVLRELDSCDFADPGTYPAGVNGCPVEVAIDTNPPGDQNFFSSSRVITVPGTISVSTAVNGAVSGFGRRLPNTDTADPNDSLVQMDEVFNGGGNSFGCCSTDASQAISLCEASVFVEYPNLTALAGSAFTTTAAAPLLFEGGPGTNFAMDEDFELPNQEYGVCGANRFQQCTRSGIGVDPGLGGNICPLLDSSFADGVQQPGEPGFVPDACDLRELGWRFQPADVTASGGPNPQRCNTAPFLFRGVFEGFCSVSENYIDDGVLGVDGDPGPDCTVRNFGPYFRPDLDCNGVDDTDEPDSCNLATNRCNVKLKDCESDFDCRATGDLCPLFSEVNAFNDANGNGRGDECECGDGDGSGLPDVSDILTANDFIFNPPLTITPAPVSIRLSHPNLSTQNNLGFFGTTSVADILNINTSIFNPGDLSSTCPRVCTGFPVVPQDDTNGADPTTSREELRRIPENEIICLN